MSLVYWNGAPLFVGGKIAFSLACCCNGCARTCIVVRLGLGSPSGVSGTDPWEPDYGTGPPQPTGTGMESTVVWHAHSYDTISTNPPRSGYHTHIWLLEVKYNIFAGLSGVPPLLPLDRYIQQLDQWVTDVIAANLSSQPGFVYEAAEQIFNGPCLSTFPAEERARAPYNLESVTLDPYTGLGRWFGEDLYGPVTTTAYPDCRVV